MSVLTFEYTLHAIPVVHVSAAFLSDFLAHETISVTRWDFPVPAVPPMYKLWPSCTNFNACLCAPFNMSIVVD